LIRFFFHPEPYFSLTDSSSISLNHPNSSKRTDHDVGAASKFTGSGGAVVALCPDGDSQVELLRKACQEAGFVVQQVKVAPSVLTDAELSSLLAS